MEKGWEQNQTLTLKNRAVFVWSLEDCFRESLILHSADTPTPGPTCSFHQLFNLISVQWLARNWFPWHLSPG